MQDFGGAGKRGPRFNPMTLVFWSFYSAVIAPWAVASLKSP
jgi:hypothetical protein